MTKKNIWDASHRPWPVPKTPWNMTQTWNDLLFAHYPIKEEVLRKLVPAALPLDSYNGMCWIGVVPFHMTDIRLRGMPPVPGTDRFPELNVRTYVTVDGKPGVYFFSLDATNLLAVRVAQTFYRLPYVHADIKAIKEGQDILYKSRRRGIVDARLTCRYRPVSEPFLAEKGSFDEWLTERYCLYTVSKKGVPLRCDIHHEPWPLQKAEAVFEENTMLTGQGINTEQAEPVLHFAKRIKVRMWPLVSAVKK